MGSSSSSSAATTSTQDNRQAVDHGGIALSAGASGNQINVTDGGLVKSGLKYLSTADQANTDRLALLLNAGNKQLAANQQLVAGAQQLTGQVLSANATQQGNVSQSTMIWVALIGVGALVLLRKG